MYLRAACSRVEPESRVYADPLPCHRGLQCSGSLIGRSHVVTAAHCVYDINESHQYVDSLNFKPGADGGAAPYGTLRWKTARVLSQFTSQVCGILWPRKCFAGTWTRHGQASRSCTCMCLQTSIYRTMQAYECGAALTPKACEAEGGALQASYTPTAMNYDFALVTLEDAAPAATGTLGLYQPPSSGSASVSLTTAGAAHWWPAACLLFHAARLPEHSHTMHACAGWQGSVLAGLVMVCWLTLAEWQSSAPAGYPGDKPLGTMWQSSCGGVKLAYAGSGPFTSVAQCSSGGCGNIMSHTCLSYDGQSGSAMWDSAHLQRAILCGKVGSRCMAPKCVVHVGMLGGFAMAAKVQQSPVNFSNKREQAWWLLMQHACR